MTHASEPKRELFLLEVERGRSVRQGLRTVRWTPNAYWSQRHRHRDWAHQVDIALTRNWRTGSYGRAAPLDGRALRGATKRRAFLEGIRGGKAPRELCELLKWSPAAYHQARYRHRDWAAEVDDAPPNVWA